MIDQVGDRPHRQAVADGVLKSTMKIDMPSDFFFTSPSGVVRSSRIIRSECCTREILDVWPFTTYRPSFFTALILIFVVSVPVVGSVTAIDWLRNLPVAMSGRYLSFCALLPL